MLNSLQFSWKNGKYNKKNQVEPEERLVHPTKLIRHLYNIKIYRIHIDKIQ